MTKAAILVGLFCVLASLDIVHGQISLASYFGDSVVASPSGDFTAKSCGTCDRLFVIRVASTDGTLTPFIFSYCFSDARISFEVGFGKTQPGNLFTYNCVSHELFVPLDPTQRTLAAEFFLSCTDFMIYKCPKNQLFSPCLGRCVPRTYPLISTLPYIPCSNLTLVSASTDQCESTVSHSLKPKCATCTTPIPGQIVSETVESVPRFYTYCPKTGRFSLDLSTELITYFKPSCSGNNPLRPLVTSKKSAGSKYFWDCRIGLVSCNSNKTFDPATNNCVPNYSSYSGDNYACKKRCSYASYQPDPYHHYYQPDQQERYQSGPSKYYQSQ